MPWPTNGRESPDGLGGEELAIHHVLWEEHFYRLLMGSNDSELTTYERLKDLHGSAIIGPCLIIAGEFVPQDERVIQSPALVLEYVPFVSLHDVSLDVTTPAVCE